MEPITDKPQKVLLRKKLNAEVMHVVDTILAVAAESGIDENWCLFNNQSTCHAFMVGNIFQTSEILMMDNIHVSAAIQE